jgi:hypothetical protein
MELLFPEQPIVEVDSIVVLRRVGVSPVPRDLWVDVCCGCVCSAAIPSVNRGDVNHA